MDLRGKVAVVTGGGTGIGEAVSHQLATAGAAVAVNYSRSRDEAEATAVRCRELGADAAALAADVGDDADCRRLAAETLERFGRIDILVNNAGKTKFADHGDLEALSADDFLDIYRVNVVGAYQMIRACAPQLKANRGAVVNVASIAGVHGIGSSSAYAASKGALITLSKSLARALAPEIRVNAVCPGYVGTRWFRDRMGEEAFQRLNASIERSTPLAHAGTAEDVAGAILFFCSDASLLTTGETLLLDAGLHLDVGPPMRPRSSAPQQAQA